MGEEVSKPVKRILDPIERITEILFGLVMLLSKGRRERRNDSLTKPNKPDQDGFTDAEPDYLLVLTVGRLAVP